MENNTKQIDNCVKMFKILKLLFEDNATFPQIMHIVSDGETTSATDNSVHSVTLNKYINTLKLFGLDVYKEKNSFHLTNPPYKVNFSETELQLLFLLKKCTNNLKENNIDYEEFNKFLNTLEMRFSDKTQEIWQQIIDENQPDRSFYYEHLDNKINICSKLCKEDFSVEILYYKMNKNKEYQMIAKAQKLLYRKNAIYLQVLNAKTRQIGTINLNKITSIKQQPTKISSSFTTNKMTVFGIRGTLAQNYKLRPWELAESSKNGWVIIINRDESEDELIKRILKYGDMCKVITPLELRQKIKNCIDETLNLYN